MGWRRARRKGERYSSVSAHGTVTEIQAAQLERDYSSALGQSLSLSLTWTRWLRDDYHCLSCCKQQRCREQQWSWRKNFFLLFVTEWGSLLCARSLNGSRTTWEMYEGNGWNAGDKHNPSLWEGLSCRELGAVDPAGATLPRNVCLIILFSWTYAVGHCWRQDHRLASPFTNLLMWKPEAYFCFSTEWWTNTWEKTQCSTK